MPRDSKRVSAINQFVGRCTASLEALHICSVRPDCDDPQADFRHCIRQVMRMLAVLVAAERMPAGRSSAGAIGRAADALNTASEGLDTSDAYQRACHEAFETSGITIFGLSDGESMDGVGFSRMAQTLIRPSWDAPIGSIYFETMPLNWLGSAYQALLALKPAKSGDGLQASYRRRKDDGVYFTPPYLVQYIVESVLGVQAEGVLNELGSRPLEERLSGLRVLDPSTGGGDFLCAAVDHLCEKTASRDEAFRARLAAECVYGVDIDPLAIETARFCVWGASGYADGVADAINSHIVCADVLGSGPDGGKLDWQATFPEIFEESRGGFDAVVGNPPYIASKNRLAVNQSSVGRGQSDSYLLFLHEAISGGLVRPDGMLAMVLPDPMLVRGNAAEVRRALAEKWTISSLLHLPGAFAEAQVANIVPICRNTPPRAATFSASRIEWAADRHSFNQRPVQTARELAHEVRIETVLAQDRSEFLYLLEQGQFGGIIRRIHGDALALSSFEPPFAPLEKLNIKAVYRGEEVGKAAIDRDSGDYPMLLGGQSVRPYEIVWEGRRINLAKIRKPIERYAGTKIVIQKSAARLIAALDRVQGEHPGYVFPQSVYGVELREPGMDERYLLCLLNSQVLNEYVRRTITGYKFVHPQLEIEDIRSLPIRQIEFLTPETERAELFRQGMDVFRTEARGSGGGGHFAELGNFAAECLATVPERSDVVHDILVNLGEQLSDLIASSRVSPGAEITARMELTRAAIEAIVWRLYSSEPFQMALPM